MRHRSCARRWTSSAVASRRAGCEAVVVVTPHNVHVEGHFAVVTAGRVGEHETDRALAADLLAAIREAGLPVVGVSYGGNDPAEAELPLDWGTEVPLHFVHAARIVVVTPARDLSLDDHVRLGEAIARGTRCTPRRPRRERRPCSRARSRGAVRLRPGRRGLRRPLPRAARRGAVSTSGRSASSSTRRRPTRSGSSSCSRVRRPGAPTLLAYARADLLRHGRRPRRAG